jgi:hypothetical protein
MRLTLPGIAIAALLATASGCTQKTCSSGETDCAGTCVRLDSDPFNCGACLRLCIGGTCSGGSCQCPAGEVTCADGACHDLQTDPLACGACGVSCGLGSCVAGVCQCDPGAQDCAGTPVCVDTTSDINHCGSCTTPCTLINGTCSGGLCACPAGRPTDCSGFCANTDTDMSHCGSCGTPCTLVNGTCSTGLCVCPVTRPTDCSGTCTNTDTDLANCGACGAPCNLVNGICSSGLCGCPVTSPTNCSGTCANTSTDSGNCGTCGHACGSGQACKTGICCAPGRPVCQSACCDGGSACCAGGDCPNQHDNGLGGSYFSCTPLNSLLSTDAQAAALSWSQQGTDQTVAGGFIGTCYAWQTTNACAVWCYNGTFPGRVKLNTISIACIGPDALSPLWN